MAKGDQLDIILGDPNLTWEDWETLGSIFELTKINQATKQEKREILNREIRHAYGNTALNLFRNNYEPDYEEIVRKTAAVLKLSAKVPLQTATVAQMEAKRYEYRFFSYCQKRHGAFTLSQHDAPSTGKDGVSPLYSHSACG